MFIKTFKPTDKADCLNQRNEESKLLIQTELFVRPYGKCADVEFKMFYDYCSQM